MSAVISEMQHVDTAVIRKLYKMATILLARNKEYKQINDSAGVFCSNKHLQAVTSLRAAVRL